MSKAKNILFRADSSSTIGTGHIMRDLVLASQYKDANIIFATQDLDGNINHKILETSYELILLKSNNIQEVITLVKNKEIDLVVIDNYKIDFKYEQILKQETDVKILAFDDTYEKHHCDILLNHNISADRKKYKALVPENCELRCGSKYTLLRDEFYKKFPKKRESKTTNILIAMGGVDSRELNIPILKVLKKFKNLEVNVVTTDTNKQIKKLKNYTKNKSWIHLHINSNQIAKLMAQNDLGIITPSVTANEAYFMKLPFIAIKTASNQNDMYKYLKKRKIPTLQKFNSSKIKIKVKNAL